MPTHRRRRAFGQARPGGAGRERAAGRWPLAAGPRQDVITGEQGAVVRQLGLADSSLSHVARAVHWIREHYAQSFRVEEVARLSGMSVSAFYRNFQAVTGISHRVGYDSPSQFSREYRRQFGMPPSQDAARIRGLPGRTAPGLV